MLNFRFSFDRLHLLPASSLFLGTGELRICLVIHYISCITYVVVLFHASHKNCQQVKRKRPRFLGLPIVPPQHRLSCFCSFN
uniref:Uncharacterized protein n=1 Tax=Rhizophora mucronata TaxID=61149 RepID=A0A2P2PYD6_RHIMU